jgi:hypothetical protein
MAQEQELKINPKFTGTAKPENSIRRNNTDAQIENDSPGLMAQEKVL